MGRFSNSTSRTGARISRPALGAAISAGVAILIAALLHANALAVGLFIDDSAELARAEAALVTTQLSLRNLSQAVLLAEDVELGVADQETATSAANEATRVVEDLEQRLNDLDVNVIIAGAAIDKSQQVLGALAEDDVSTAGELLATETLDAYVGLRDSVVEMRDSALGTLNNAQSLTQRIGTIAGFLIALLAPALAIFAYWRIARRQLDHARVEMDSRLSAERRVIKAKDEFISNISHELRTPLTSIYGFSEILIDQGLIDPEEAHTLISVINEESAELNRMVEDLLTVARDEAGNIAYNIATLDLAEEIGTVVKPLQRSGVSIEFTGPVLQVEADQLRTRQILRNLLANAHRWGGDNLVISTEQIGATAVITVADDGPGVPHEMEQRLFTRYMHEGDTALTTGTIGLGLAVVKILAEGMQGEARYRRENGWTEFSIHLPLARSTADAVPGEPVPGERSVEVA
jgi:signal transduction histidine kinase